MDDNYDLPGVDFGPEDPADFRSRDRNFKREKSKEIEIDASWSKLAEKVMKAEIKPELVQTEDPEVRQQIQKAAEAQRRKEKVFQNAEFHFGRPVLGKILILPISAARQFTYNKPWAAISIASAPVELPVLSGENRIGLLQLCFEDLDAVPGEAFAKAFPHKAENLFKEDHANKILDFVCDLWEKTNLLMIHCYAGASRSPAVGKALADVLQPRFSPYYDKIYQPNILVYRTIKEVYTKNFEAVS